MAEVIKKSYPKMLKFIHTYLKNLLGLLKIPTLLASDFIHNSIPSGTQKKKYEAWMKFKQFFTIT